MVPKAFGRSALLGDPKLCFQGPALAHSWGRRFHHKEALALGGAPQGWLASSPPRRPPPLHQASLPVNPTEQWALVSAQRATIDTSS